MRRAIPAPLLSVCAEITARRETHASLDRLFAYAGAPGDPPEGSKPVKSMAWLRAVNKDNSLDPLNVLGRLIENYMEDLLDPDNTWDNEKLKDCGRIIRVLSQCELQYVRGGKIVGALGAPSRNLGDFVKQQDISNVEFEFDRALSNVETNPREAISAASNILETVCKIYIEEEELERPTKLDLRSVWSIVRKDLGFDPGSIEDKDLQQILSGILSIVEGVGSLRTHASSAHGAGKKSYKMEPRHARLAIHASHTITLFVLETWEKKKRGKAQSHQNDLSLTR